MWLMHVLLLCFTILCISLSLQGLRVSLVLYLSRLVFLHFGCVIDFRIEFEHSFEES